MRTIKFYSAANSVTTEHQSDAGTLSEFLAEIGQSENQLKFFVKSSSVGRAPLLGETRLPNEDCTILAVTANQKAGATVKINVTEVLNDIKDKFDSLIADIETDLTEGYYDLEATVIETNTAVDLDIVVDEEPSPSVPQELSSNLREMTESEKLHAEAMELASK